MTSSVEPSAKPSAHTAPGEPHVGAEASIAALAITAFGAFREWVTDSIEVVALESRVAGFALAAVSGVAVAATLLLLTAWGLLIAAVVAALMQGGASLWLALAIVAGGNMALAAVLIASIPRLSRRLTFQTTRNLFRKGPG